MRNQGCSPVSVGRWPKLKVAGDFCVCLSCLWCLAVTGVLFLDSRFDLSVKLFDSSNILSSKGSQGCVAKGLLILWHLYLSLIAPGCLYGCCLQFVSFQFVFEVVQMPNYTTLTVLLPSSAWSLGVKWLFLCLPKQYLCQPQCLILLRCPPTVGFDCSSSCSILVKVLMPFCCVCFGFLSHVSFWHACCY